MAVESRQAYAGEQAPERTPDVENGLRLVAMLFEKVRELDERLERLEREQREQHRIRARRRRAA